MTQIIITLVAVVLLILVIGFFAMRYLRADEHDPFDEAPDERTTRSRDGAGDRDYRDDDRVVPLADRAGRGGRLGRRGGDSGPAEQDRSGARRAYQGRGPGGRQDREPAGARRGSAGDREFGGPGFDTAAFDGRGGDGRAAGDRGFGGPAFGGPGDTGGFDGRGAGDRAFGAPGQADRGSRGGRGGEPPQQARPAAASARNGRGKGRDAGGPDWDSMSDIDYWTELASDKPLTTTAQPAGPTGRPGQDPQPEARGTRPGRADAGPASTGPRPAGSRSGSSRSGGSGQRGSAAMSDDSTALLPRRHAPTGPGSVLPAARAGAAAADLAGRDGRAVASAADSLAGRGGRSAARAARAAAAGRDAGRPAADLGSRGGSYPDGRGGPAAGAGLSGRGPDPRSQDPRSHDPRGQDPRSQDQSLSALARLGTPSGPGNGAAPGRQAPLDDDPLTSPSFPAIRTADSRSYRRSDNSAGGSRGARGPAGYGAPSAGGPAVTGGGSMSSGPAGNGATGNGIPPAPTAVYSTMTRPGSPDPRSAPSADSGYDSGRSAGRPASWEGGYGQQAASAGTGHGAVNGHSGNGHSGNGHGAVNGGAADSGTGPNSYRPPAASASGYQGYPDPSSSAPSGNPYGSYVSAPADSYQASRPNSDGGYGSYVSSAAETQAYAQPSAIQPAAAPPPVHAAPVYENGAGYPAQGAGAAGYGASWPGANGYSGQAQPGYQGGAPSQPGYAIGHNGNGHNGAGHSGNGHNANGQGTGPYDQSSYPPPDGNGSHPDQRGYGGQDSGYGQGGYGSYPGY